VMKRNVVCYEEDTPTLAICEFLSRVAIRGVVIVNKGFPTGLITRSCLLRFFINMLAARRIDGVSPEVDAVAFQLVERMANSQPRDRIAQTVRSLTAEACDLESRMSRQDGELVAGVVGGASRMQELVIDLLAISRFANSSGQIETEAAQATGASQVSGALQFATSSSIESPPNFSITASAITIATIASPTTAAAGTAHTSLRSIAAGLTSIVDKSTERRGFIRVEIGFMYAVTRRSWPLVTPPSRPPALFVGRESGIEASPDASGPGRISSWTREPGTSATAGPRPMPTALIAGIDISACARRPSSLRSQCT